MDRSTFERRSLEHLDAVWRMARQLARDEQSAADLVQETYLRALRACEGFEERAGGLRSWLFRILHNVFFTEHQRAKRRPMAMEDAGVDVAHPGPEPDGDVPLWNLAGLDWECIDDRIKAAIERLRTDFREVLLLWAVEGLKYREIAEILEVPIGTVMSRLHRARATLTEELREVAEERRLRGGSPQ